MKSKLTFAIGLWCFTALPRCVQVSDGIEVDVAYQPEAMPAQIRTDIGYRVHLERALIAVGQVERALGNGVRFLQLCPIR